MKESPKDNDLAQKEQEKFKLKMEKENPLNVHKKVL